MKVKTSSPFAILVTTKPRGDALAVFCRLLGLEVIRGHWEHGGWPAVTRMAELIAAGTRAIVTPDGGGPRRVARPGVLVLAAVAGFPLLVLGADCRPALTEPRKWDQPRNPVPFCGIAIAMNQPVLLDNFETAAAVESARLELQRSLDEAHRAARRALGLPHQ